MAEERTEPEDLAYKNLNATNLVCFQKKRNAFPPPLGGKGVYHGTFLTQWRLEPR